ncbi:MAG: hypothetical protein M3Z14_03225 [Candidatus Eremiobacteraeota bacterium]|nr:hypothetical protein [Candidatus Eremiobacteraeota bacterium]
MNENIITGVFADKDTATQAISDVRSLNYPQEAIDVSGVVPTLTVRVRAATGDEEQLRRILGSGAAADAQPEAYNDVTRNENLREDAVMSADDTGMVRKERMIVEGDLAEAQGERP